MKTLKNFGKLFAVLATVAVIVACENEESASTQPEQSTNFEYKTVDKVYYGSGSYNSSLNASCSIFLPNLPSGSSYVYYTNNVYNFSYNNGTTSENVVLIFMEMAGIPDADLTGEAYRSTMQTPFSFSLSNVINVPGSVPLNTNNDIKLILMHDDGRDLSYAISQYFGQPIDTKIPKKAGMTLINKT